MAPYGTTLLLMQDGVRTGDMTAAQKLSDHAKAFLPDTPESFERSLLENVDGLIALFDKNVDAAHAAFVRAILSSDANPVAVLNAAFTDVQLGRFERAEARVAGLLTGTASRNTMLHSAAHMTRAAALLAQGRVREANSAAETATRINPGNSHAWYVQSVVRAAMNDREGAERMRQRAYQTNDSVDNYAEVAALYFLLPTAAGTPLTVSPFRSPELDPTGAP
jgi:tetratricopeptide (TPR) repeat protein